MLYRRNNGWELVALGMNGVTLGDRQLFGGERCDIRGSQTISLFPYSLTLDLPKAEETTREHQRQAARRSDVGPHPRHPRRTAAADGPHGRLGRRRWRPMTNTCCGWSRRSTTSPAAAKNLTNANSPLVAHIAGYGLRDRLLANLTVRARRTPRTRPVHRSALEPHGDGRARARKRSRRDRPIRREA